MGRRLASAESPSGLFCLPWEGLQRALSWFDDAHGSGDARVSVVMGGGTRLGVVHLPETLLTAIAVVYGGVCAYFIARFVWRCRRLVVLRNETGAASLTGEAANVWMRCSKQFGIEDASIHLSSQIFGPVTFGIFRRLVLLPSGMIAGLPETDLHAVIAHEFAHLRRNDFLKNLVYEFLSLPVSYHPLLWRARERLTETREMVCDEMVAVLSGRDEYAHSLLRLASLLLEGVPVRTPHAIGIFDANTLERRLMRLTEKQKEIRGTGRFAIATACVLLGAGTCGSALALATNVDGMVALGGESPKSRRTSLGCRRRDGEIRDHEGPSRLPRGREESKNPGEGGPERNYRKGWGGRKPKGRLGSE